MHKYKQTTSLQLTSEIQESQESKFLNQSLQLEYQNKQSANLVYKNPFKNKSKKENIQSMDQFQLFIQQTIIKSSQLSDQEDQCLNIDNPNQIKQNLYHQQSTPSLQINSNKNIINFNDIAPCHSKNLNPQKKCQKQSKIILKKQFPIKKSNDKQKQEHNNEVSVKISVKNSSQKINKVRNKKNINKIQKQNANKCKEKEQIEGGKIESTMNSSQILKDTGVFTQQKSNEHSTTLIQDQFLDSITSSYEKLENKPVNQKKRSFSLNRISQMSKQQPNHFKHRLKRKMTLINEIVPYDQQKHKKINKINFDDLFKKDESNQNFLKIQHLKNINCQFKKIENPLLEINNVLNSDFQNMNILKTEQTLDLTSQRFQNISQNHSFVNQSQENTFYLNSISNQSIIIQEFSDSQNQELQNIFPQHSQINKKPIKLNLKNISKHIVANQFKLVKQFQEQKNVSDNYDVIEISNLNISETNLLQESLSSQLFSSNSVFKDKMDFENEFLEDCYLRTPSVVKYSPKPQLIVPQRQIDLVGGQQSQQIKNSEIAEQKIDYQKQIQMKLQEEHQNLKDQIEMWNAVSELQKRASLGINRRMIYLNDDNSQFNRCQENPENDNRIPKLQNFYPKRDMTVIIEELNEASFIQEEEQQNHFNFQNFLKDQDNSIEKQNYHFQSTSKLDYSKNELEILSLQIQIQQRIQDLCNSNNFQQQNSVQNQEMIVNKINNENESEAVGEGNLTIQILQTPQKKDSLVDEKSITVLQCSFEGDEESCDMKSDKAPIAQTHQQLPRLSTFECAKKNTQSFINKTEPMSKSLTLLNQNIFSRKNIVSKSINARNYLSFNNDFKTYSLKNLYVTQSFNGQPNRSFVSQKSQIESKNIRNSYSQQQISI